MSDLISRADAIEAVRLETAKRGLLGRGDILDILSALPSADAVQGEWIEKYNGNGWNDFWDYTCSNCGKKYERADAVLYHANYCPNCGARMKGGAE